MRAERHSEIKLELALECLNAAGSLTLRVAGSSMLPAIPPGSRVAIRRVVAAELTVGDVILWRATDGVRLHRLVEIQGCGADARWITRGDNYTHRDPPLTFAQILGVCTHVEPPMRGSLLRRLLRRAA